MERYCVLSIDNVLPFIVIGNNKNKIKYKFNNYEVRVDSDRLNVFKKNLKCIKCGRIGNYFAIENAGNCISPHLNLYSEDHILMTKDHIIPKSKGGKDHIDNYQTMCKICNENKGDKNE